jgi:L-fuculose-phosphate aldolase
MDRFRNQMMAASRWLARRGYAAGEDGVLSQRIDSGRILITPRGKSLHWIGRQDLVLVGTDGRRLQGTLEPALALQLHLAVYSRRDDAGAVILAQPPSAMAFAVAGIPLVQPVIPEMVLTIGSVPLAPHTTPFSSRTADTIGRLLDGHDALLLQSRGVLILAADLLTALEKLERIESLASALIGAKNLGHVNLLSGGHIKELMSLRQKLNLTGRNPWVQPDQEDDDV